MPALIRLKLKANTRVTQVEWGILNPNMCMPKTG
jgi:hypothetical protein